jgi:hypothetical protein
MPSITAPLVETQAVVTGTMYQITIGEEQNGTGITRIDIGPYQFPGVGPQLDFPEAVTNELCPPGWQPIRWYVDAKGAAWLRFDGGRLLPEQGEMVFQYTSNHSPTSDGSAYMVIWRDGRSEKQIAPVPDYSVPPPARNTRHDSTGQGRAYKQWGCMPQLILGALVILAVALLAH